MQTSLLLAPGFAPIRTTITGILEMCEQLPAVWTAALSSESDSQLLESMPVELERNVSFVTAGLRGISRVGGESALEALADRLDWRGG